MRKQTFGILLAVMGAFLISGCAAVLVGAAAAGAGSGTYLYINGEMKTDYYSSFDAVIDDEDVHISVTYKAKDVTTVSVRIGLFGNKLSSQLIHDKILGHLTKKQG